MRHRPCVDRMAECRPSMRRRSSAADPVAHPRSASSTHTGILRSGEWMAQNDPHVPRLAVRCGCARIASDLRGGPLAAGLRNTAVLILRRVQAAAERIARHGMNVMSRWRRMRQACADSPSVAFRRRYAGSFGQVLSVHDHQMGVPVRQSRRCRSRHVLRTRRECDEGLTDVDDVMRARIAQTAFPAASGIECHSAPIIRCSWNAGRGLTADGNLRLRGAP